MSSLPPQLTPVEAPPLPEVGGFRVSGAPRWREGGSVLLSAESLDGRPAALQVTAEPVTSRRVRARFRRLARRRAEVVHPALVGVHAFGEHGGRLYVATEPVPERSFGELLRDGPMRPSPALGLLAAAAEGLDHAHEHGLVHRTLSGDSILLDSEGVRLDLFGLFALAGQPGWGDVVRRDPHLRYEPPEAVRGEELTPASNVYAFSGLLLHALTGREPYSHHDPVMIEYAHVSEPPPTPTEIDPGLPAELDAVVARGMAKDPARRPATAAALVAEAASALGVEPAPARRRSGAAAPASPRRAPRSVAPAVAPVAPPAAAEPPVEPPAAAEPPAASEAPTVPEPAPPPAATKPAAPVDPPAAAEPPGPVEPPAAVEPPAPAEPPAAVEPPTVAEPPRTFQPPAAEEPPPAGKRPKTTRRAPRPPRTEEPVTVPEVWAAGFAAQPATAGKLDPPPDSGSVVVRPPLAARLRPYAPLLVVIAVAAVFGALLGTPSDSPDPPPAASASPDAAAVARLDTTRVRLRDDLAIATEPAEQSAAAESLADAYERAAGRIASARVAAAARRAAAAYSALAGAARGESDADYAAAAGRVEVAEAKLADALGSR